MEIRDWVKFFPIFSLTKIKNSSISVDLVDSSFRLDFYAAGLSFLILWFWSRLQQQVNIRRKRRSGRFGTNINSEVRLEASPLPVAYEERKSSSLRRESQRKSHDIKTIQYVSFRTIQTRALFWRVTHKSTIITICFLISLFFLVLLVRVLSWSDRLESEAEASYLKKFLFLLVALVA